MTSLTASAYCRESKRMEQTRKNRAPTSMILDTGGHCHGVKAVSDHRLTEFVFKFPLMELLCYTDNKK